MPVLWKHYLLKPYQIAFLIQILLMTGCGSGENHNSESLNSSPGDLSVTIKVENNSIEENAVEKEQSVSLSQKENKSPAEKIENAVIPEDVPSSASSIPVQKFSQATHIDKKNRIWIENVPYEVWFKNPLEVLGDPTLLSLDQSSLNQNIKKSLAINIHKDNSPDKSIRQNSEIKSSGNQDPLWKKLITAKLIKDEINSIRNHLNGSFRSVAQFNKSLEQIELDCTMLASLGFLVESQNLAVSWQNSAWDVIHLSTKISESSVSRGRKNFKTGKTFFDRLSTLLEGNQSVQNDSPQQLKDLSEIAERSSIMERMEQINDLLTSEINSEKKFEANQKKLIHESSLLAILTQTILNGSYESSEEEKYKDAGSNMVKEALELSKSAIDNDYSRWTELTNRIRKRCDQCHAEYRL
jgi:hypothetical protein